MKHLMLDLETLGKTSTAPVIQIGACYFNPKSKSIGKTFIRTIGLGDNDLYSKFTPDISTMVWWLQQDTEAIKSVMHGDCKLEQSAIDFRKFANNASEIWSHSTFDFVIMQHVFSIYGIKPLPYKSSKDIRTLTHLAKINKSEMKRPPDNIQHNALNDALFQAAYCIDYINRITVIQGEAK